MREIPHSPGALYEVAHPFGTLIAETILASVHVRAPQIGRTYGRKRSDQSAAKHLARRGPSTYGESGLRSRYAPTARDRDNRLGFSTVLTVTGKPCYSPGFRQQRLLPGTPPSPVTPRPPTCRR